MYILHTFRQPKDETKSSKVHSVEYFPECEKRSVTDVTKDDVLGGDGGEEERVEDREDLDDSARAESIVSISSTVSTARSRELKDR